MSALLVALAFLQGSTKPAYGLPPALRSVDQTRLAGIVRPRPGAIPAWEVMPPGAREGTVQPGLSTVKVPILMYHYIRELPSYRADPIGWGLSTPPADFRQQMDYLDQNGFHPITLTNLRAYLQGKQPLPSKPVVLTFDDGYLDLYTEAFPVLKQHHFTAVAYIVGGFFGRAGNVTVDQVREMDAYGIEIGAHTMDHVDLTRADPATRLWEIQASRTTLESIVGHPVLDFCYPSGRFNQAVVDDVKAAGFESATLTMPGSVHYWEDRYTWTRVRVSGGESLATFANGLEEHEEGSPPPSLSPIQVPRVYPLIFGVPPTRLG